MFSDCIETEKQTAKDTAAIGVTDACEASSAPASFLSNVCDAFVAF